MSPVSRSRLLLLGLDGATFDLIAPWVAEGRLPTLVRLLREGAAGPMRSVPNRNSAAAWSSIVTGMNPGKHGIYWFVEYRDDYSYVFINASFREGAPLWRLLGEAGRPALVLNVPMTYPAEPLDGVLIAGLDGPGAHDPRFAYPPGIVAEVEAALGAPYIVEVGMPGLVKAGRYDEALAEAHRAIDQRAAVARHLMRTRPWDLCMLVFRETDPVQHFFWKFMAPDGFRVDPAAVARYGGAIREVYEHIDAALGTLVAEAGPHDHVMVISDHGAGPDSGKARSLQRWLAALGLLRFRADGRAGWRGRALRALFAGVHALDRRLPVATKRRLAHALPGLRQRTKVLMSYAHIDWQGTRAYSDGKRPDIWINLRGRQPAGQVAPGAEYDALCEFIRRQFTAARGLPDGRPVVRAVYLRDEVYHGPHVVRSPDLIVEWERGAAPEAVLFPDGTVVRMREGGLDPMEQLVCGGHEPEGILILRGPAVAPGARVEGATVMDVAPTALYLLGEAVPEAMDGVVRAEALRAEVTAAHPPRTRHAVAAAAARAGYDRADEAAIRDRLRGLGYVD